MKKKKVIKVLKKVKTYCKHHTCDECKYNRICMECFKGIPMDHNLKRGNL